MWLEKKLRKTFPLQFATALSAFACFAGSASWISWNTANNLALLKRWVEQQQLHANKAYKVGMQLSKCLCVCVCVWGNISQVANWQLTTTQRATTCGADTNEVHTKCGSCNCNGKCNSNNNNCSNDGCNNCCKWQLTAPAVAKCARQLFSTLCTYPVKWSQCRLE